MSRDAEKHLRAAKNYIAKGDEFYRKAKPEIELAVAAGASQREVSRYLLRSQSWIRDVIAWDGTGTLYGTDTEARQIRQAKQVLRDPDLRQKTVDQLSETERVEVASAALEPERTERKRMQDDRSAVRQERAADPGATHYQMVLLDLAKSEGAMRDATAVSREARFNDDYQARLLARIQVTADVLDVLRMAIAGTENVDWDAELARLDEAARATEGEQR